MNQQQQEHLDVCNELFYEILTITKAVGNISTLQEPTHHKFKKEDFWSYEAHCKVNVEQHSDFVFLANIAKLTIVNMIIQGGKINVFASSKSFPNYPY